MYHFTTCSSAPKRSMRSTNMYLVGLTFFVPVILTDAVALVTNSNVQRPNTINWAGLLTDSETGVSRTRFLRKAGGDDEERVGFADKIISAFSSSQVTPQKLESWLNKGESSDAVFAHMQLTKAGDNLFDNPHFASWVQYTDDLHAKMSKEATSAISTLTTRYGDDALYNLIEAAKNEPSTWKLATKLQIEQMEHWVKVGKDPDDVFHLFKLDKTGDQLFSNPEFTAWVKYVDDFNAKHVEEPASITPTLMNYYSEDVLFKMAEAAKKETETKDIATKLETEWLQTWLRNRKSPDKALIDFGFGKAADTLLESPLFSIWAKYLDDFNEKYPDKKTTMIETFTKTFGDAGVTTMLHAAKKSIKTYDIAKKLKSDQLKMWLSSEKSADDLFMTLHLDKIGYDFNDNPLFKTWMSYANVFIKKHPEKKTSVFSSWEDHISDRLLIKMLEEAKKFPAMENAASKVQTEKIQGILARKNTPEEIFKLLGLDDAGDDILTTPLFQPWLEYVKDFNKHNPNQRVYWYDVLRTKSNWFVLERSIEQALANPSTAKIGKMVESARFKFWLDRRKRSPEDVFHFLYLKETGEHTLASSKFKVWSKYLDDFNERFPDRKTTMFDVLKANYGDRMLLKMFNNAKNDPKSKKVATELQNGLINKWLVDKKTPADLKKRFNDVETADELIQRYVKEFEKVSGNT